MKQKIFYFLTGLLLLVNFQKVTAQQSSFCTDFNNGSFAGWKSQNIDMSIEANGPNGNSDKFLKGKDDFGTSFAYNDIDFKGDWTKHLGKCLCWNVKAIITGSGATEITPSFSIYVGTPTDPANASLRAAFYANFKINDASGWKRLCAPIALLDANGNLPKNSYGEWKMIKGTNADWNTLLSKVQVMSYGFDYGPSNDETYGVDNICLKDCEVIGGGSYCGCPNSTNLITNGDFENGAMGFTSKFELAKPNSKYFVPGMYTITNQTGATSLCQNWYNGSCARTGSTNGSFLIVNGQTGQTGVKTVWNQDIKFETGKDYKLCMTLRNLPQCCFNVNPKVTITYFDGIKRQTLGPIDVTVSSCPGQKVTFNISIPQNASPTINSNISIDLDQSGLGDGNDLAIDDISLIQLSPMNVDLIDFNFSKNSINATQFNITATPLQPLPAGGGFSWEVWEFSPQTGLEIPGTKMSNPSSWWTLNCSFPGYGGGTPGIFEAGKWYRIGRGTWSDCNSWGYLSYVVRKDPATGKIEITRDNNYKPGKPVINN